METKTFPHGNNELRKNAMHLESIFIASHTDTHTWHPERRLQCEIISSVSAPVKIIYFFLICLFPSFFFSISLDFFGQSSIVHLCVSSSFHRVIGSKGRIKKKKKKRISVLVQPNFSLLLGPEAAVMLLPLPLATGGSEDQPQL